MAGYTVNAVCLPAIRYLVLHTVPTLIRAARKRDRSGDDATPVGSTSLIAMSAFFQIVLVGHRMSGGRPNKKPTCSNRATDSRFIHCGSALAGGEQKRGRTRAGLHPACALLFSSPPDPARPAAHETLWHCRGVCGTVLGTSGISTSR
jgi:hypothetical protein